MINIIVLVFLIIVGVFVHPESWGFWGLLFFKILVLTGIFYFAYDYWKENPPESSHDEQDVEVDEERDSAPIPERFFENAEQAILRSLHRDDHLLEFLRKQFSVIWNFILPHNGMLLLMQNDRVRILFKRCRENIFKSGEWESIPVLTLIDNADGFLVENQVENGNTLIPYYKPELYQPRAFLGLQSPLNENSALYWLFDAETYDFFNREDMPILRKINDNTLAYLHQIVKNDSMHREVVLLNKSFSLMQELSRSLTIKSAINCFTDFIADEFQASRLTIGFRKDFAFDADEGVIVKAVGVEDSFKSGTTFPLGEGLNGWVILKDRPYLLENIDKGEYFIPRFSRKEKTNYGLRSFLSVPIHFQDHAVGMVTLEHEVPGKFSVKDKELLIQYANLLSGVLDRLIKEKQIGG